MITKKLEILKNSIQALDEQKFECSQHIDSITLINNNLSRSKLTNTKKSMSLKDRKSYASQLTHYESAEEKKLLLVMKRIFQARCKDMKVEFNESSWSGFWKAITLKRKQFEIQDEDCPEPTVLNLSGLNLEHHSFEVINSIITEYQFVDISRNQLHWYEIKNIGYSTCLKQLKLNNCGLTNEDIGSLLKLLLKTSIKTLSLSSPDLKNRNILTKYEALCNLIEKSTTLQTLQLANIQISPSSPLFAAAKSSCSLKKLDVSKNTGVVGISKNLHELNFSWNEISQPFLLKSNETQLKVLNLTGNPIPPYLFQQFLVTSNYPELVTLILNNINLNEQLNWLQLFIDRSKSLKSLQLKSCQLSKGAFLNIAYGLEQNKTLKILNLSKNKFPNKNVMTSFAFSLHKSQIAHLNLSECDIKDEMGAELFKDLYSNNVIEQIDVSKNSLGMKSSLKICESLKKGCYSLNSLNITQNFIKYDQAKEIIAYIDRNIYMSKIKIHDEHRRFKKILSEDTEVEKKIEETRVRLNSLVEETSELSNQYIKELNIVRNKQIEMGEKQLVALNEEEKNLLIKISSIENQLEELEERCRVAAQNPEAKQD